MSEGRILHYQLVETLGAGGMAVVHKAIDTRLGRTVALKLLPPVVTAREEARERLKVEARAVARLDHPNIGALHALEHTGDGQLFLVMAHYPGETLEERLERGPLPLADALDLTRQTLQGLAHAHRAGVVHRDVKPGNLMLTPEGRVVILDFGLARLKEPTGLTQDGALMGTMAYMAPEQARGRAVDGRADLWSVGVVLYEMLTGVSPFLGEGGMASTLLRILSHRPAPASGLCPGVPPAVDTLLGRVLATDPELRPADAEAFLADLDAVAASAPEAAAPGDSGSLPTLADEMGTVPVPGRPPRPRSPLVGRDDELGVIALHLADPACQILTLLGPGGTGKTRLCLEVGHRQASGEAFPDGIVFVELDALTDPARLPSRIAEALDLPLTGTDDAFDRLVRRIGDDRILLILDNFEQVVESAPLVADLVGRCPRLAVLVSSRERLDIDDEWIVPIQGLPIPPAAEDPAALPQPASRYAAVELFVQRARRVRPDFRLTPDTLPGVIEICRLTKGLPLGVELAAAWVRSVPPAEIATEIRRNHDFLASTSRSVVERHRSLRAVFEHSWALLGTDERTVLSRLSVFRGGFATEAATEIATAGLALLTALVDRSLLEVDGAGRFELHTLLRQYAEEKLAERPDDERRVREAHGRWYLTQLARWGGRFRGPDQGRAFAAVDLDLNNLRSAWAWAVDEGHTELLGRASEAFRIYHDQRGLIGEGLEQIAAAAATAAAAADPAPGALGQLWVDQAWLALRAGRYAEARGLAERGLARLRAASSIRGVVLGLNAVGAAVAREGDYPAARAGFVEALTAARSAGDPELLALCLDNLASVEQAQGRVRQAETHYRESLAFSRQAGDLAQVALNLNNLGSLVLSDRGPAQAAPLFGESLELARRLGLNRLVPFLLANLGLVAYHLGRFDHAADRFREALERVRKGGEAWLEPGLRTQLGRTSLRQHRFEDAEDHLLDALRVAWRIQDLPMVLQALTLLCELDLTLGEETAAPSLLALVLAHPATQPPDREHARSLLERSAAPPVDPDGELAPLLGAAVRRVLQRTAAAVDAGVPDPARPL